MSPPRSSLRSRPPRRLRRGSSGTPRHPPTVGAGSSLARSIQAPLRPVPLPTPHPAHHDRPELRSHFEQTPWPGGGSTCRYRAATSRTRTARSCPRLQSWVRRSGMPGSIGQDRLGAVEGLDQALCVDAHAFAQRVRRRHVEADNVGTMSRSADRPKLEGSELRLQAEGLPQKRQIVVRDSPVPSPSSAATSGWRPQVSR